MCLLLVVYKKYFHVGIIIGVMLLRNSPKICFFEILRYLSFVKLNISNSNENLNLDDIDDETQHLDL